MTAILINRYVVPILCVGAFLTCLLWLCLDPHEPFTLGDQTNEPYVERIPLDN
jgi:hypothetical protein